jgi:hypothetical protein
MYPLHLLNPSINLDLQCQYIVTALFVPAEYYVSDTASFVYYCHWSSLWVEISTLAYGMKIFVAQKGCQWRTVPI